MTTQNEVEYQCYVVIFTHNTPRGQVMGLNLSYDLVMSSNMSYVVAFS